MPPGFVVTTGACRSIMERSGARATIEGALAAVDRARPGTLAEAERRIRDVLGSTEPDDIATAVGDAYGALGRQLGVEAPRVAVRSSATAEDAPTGSFAGEYETYLDVRGADAVCECVVRCWTSLFSRRAIDYALEQHLSPLDISMAVVVQKMVRAKAAGVMFTLSPVTGDRSRIVIEASWGLGHAVVAGEVTPDRYTLDKVKLEVVERHVASKEFEYIDGAHQRKVPPERRSLPCLDAGELHELGAMAKRLERLEGRPQDIEWAIDRDVVFPDNVVFLQCRPETVWSRRERGPVFDPSAGVMNWITANLLSRSSADRDKSSS